MRLRAFIFLFLCLCPLFGAGVEVGQYDDPRDLTIKIIDPFSQENTDLMQPVVGEYDIKVLPPHVDERDRTGKYNVEGLYFKQIDRFIYIDIRQPPRQKKAGAYDLFVSLKVPGQADTSNRLRRNIIYTDAATDVVLLIDNSMSMKKNDPQGLRFSACENFIRLASLSEKIEKVGLIKFSGSATKILDWTSPAVADKKGIGALLASQRSGSFTNINEAFEVASEMFEDSVATEKIAVLLTDGKNEPDRYRDTHDFLRELGVKVYTVGLSKNADSSQLEIIAEETGGEYFEAVDDGRLMQIYNKIAQQLNEFRTIGSGESVRKLNFPLTTYDQLVEINLYGYPKGASFALKDPQDETPVRFQMINGGKGQKTTLLRLSRPKSGMYHLEAVGGDAFSYDINVQSKLFMKVFPMDSKYLRGEVAHLAVSLAHRQSPVLKGDIFATLSRPDGQVMTKVQLFDDGVHGDNHADDGVYCAILPLDFAEGMVEVEFSASGTTADGQKTVRIERGNFRILEAGQGVKDYFLASILPLYMDLGQVKQGTLAKASLRLSFEGREKKRVSFERGDSIISKIDEEAAVPWEAISFPESFDLNPSEARVVTLSWRVPTSQALGPYSGSFLVRIGDHELQVPVDVIIKKGDLVRMATEVEALKPDIVEKENVIAPLSKIEGEPKKMVENFLPHSKASEPEPTWKKEVGATDVGAVPKGGAKPDSLRIREEARVLEPIEYTLSPEKIGSFQVEDGDYASLIFRLQNLSEHGGNIQLRLDGPGRLEREEVWLAAGSNLAVGWYWEAGELELAQRKIALKTIHHDEEKVRSWSWSPIPKEPPWALIYTLIILGVVGLVYGISFLIQGQLPHAYVSLSSWAHFVLVLWAFWHLLPINFEELELDRDLLTFELQWEEPLERELEVPEEELLVEERPEETLPDAKELPKVMREIKIERDMKDLPEVDQSSRSVSLQSSEVRPQDRERDLDSETMLDATPTVISVNDRPKRRAVLKKRDESKVVSKEVEREKDAKVLRREGAKLKDISPKPEERDLKLAKPELKDLLPDVMARSIDPSLMKPLQDEKASPLDLKEEVAQMGVREREERVMSDRNLKVDPLQLDDQIAKTSMSDNVLEATRPLAKKVTLSSAGESPKKALEGGVVTAAAPSVKVEAQNLEIEKESIRRIVEEVRETAVAEISEKSVSLDGAPLEGYVPLRDAAGESAMVKAGEGEVGLQSMSPVVNEAGVGVGAWSPKSQSEKIDMKVEESWISKDQVQAIVVEQEEVDVSGGIRPSQEEEALLSRRSFSESTELQEKRVSVTIESAEVTIEGMEREEFLVEQPVRLILEEKQVQRVVKQGAGAVIRMEEPEPSELPAQQ